MYTQVIEETPVGTDIDVATIGPVEVIIAETRHIDIDSGEVVAQSDIVSIGGTIIQTRDEIDRSNEVVNYTDARKIAEFVNPPTTFDFTKVNSIHSYEEHVSDVNTTLQGIGNATTEDAYTYGINRLKNNKKPRPIDWIVGHIFGGTYDLWIHEYNEEDRTFFGFASFGGLFDQDAEWGYVSLDELLETKIPPIGHKLERDFYFNPCTLDSLKNAEQKAYYQKEQAIQLGSDLGEEEDEEPPRIPWQVEHENHIMLAG